MRHVGIFDYFDEVVSVDDAGDIGKDRPDVYLLAASRLGIEPTDCTVFEDLLVGMRSAKSVGMRVWAMHEPVKVTDAIDFAAMTVLTLVLLNAIVQPFLYRFSPYRAMAAIFLSIGVIVGTVIGLCKALPELEKTVEQLAEAISRL